MKEDHYETFEAPAETIELFEKCEADVYLKQARDALSVLG